MSKVGVANAKSEGHHFFFISSVACWPSPMVSYI